MPRRTWCRAPTFSEHNSISMRVVAALVVKLLQAMRKKQRVTTCDTRRASRPSHTHTHTHTHTLTHTLTHTHTRTHTHTHMLTLLRHFGPGPVAYVDEMAMRNSTKAPATAAGGMGSQRSVAQPCVTSTTSTPPTAAMGRAAGVMNTWLSGEEGTHAGPWLWKWHRKMAYGSRSNATVAVVWLLSNVPSDMVWDQAAKPKWGGGNKTNKRTNTRRNEQAPRCFQFKTQSRRRGATVAETATEGWSDTHTHTHARTHARTHANDSPPAHAPCLGA